MEVFDTRLEGSQLWLRFSGEYGHGTKNNRSGHIVQNALEETLKRHDGVVSEVVVDYSLVNNIGGDGPTWSMGPAFRRKLAVRCVASGTNYVWLSKLFFTTKLDGLIQLEFSGNL